MKPQFALVAAVMTVALAAPLAAQTASGTDTAGAYDALPEGNRKIVSAIYESQFGSPNDTAGGTLLTRDEIAAMKQDTGWGNAYRQLYDQGLVSERNLGQAISTHNRSIHSTAAGAPGVTVVTTAGGDQMAVGRGKSGGGASSVKTGGRPSATAKTDHGKPSVVTNAGGGSVVTNASGSAVGANAASAHSAAGGVSRAGGHGNGQALGKNK